MKKILGIPLLIIAFLLSGCTFRGNDLSSSQAEETISPSSSAQASGSDAEGLQNGAVQTVLAKLDDGRPWSPLAITNEGTVYGFTAATDQAASQILCYHMKTGKTDTLYTAEKGFQPSDFSMNGDYLLWNEYVPPSPTDKIKVVLYDRNSKTAKVLKDSRNQQNIDPPRISLGETSALWSEVSSGGESAQIFQYDFKLAKRSTLKTTATSPAIGDNFIAWIGPETDTSANGAVFVKSLTDNSIQKITNSEGPMELVAFGDKLVYSGYSSLDYLDPNKKVYESELVLYANGQKKVIEKSTDHLYGSPQISGSYVSWYENAATRVYSIKEDKIITLQQTYGEALSCDSYIMWTTADPAETKDQAIKDGMYTMKVSIISMDS